MCDLLSALPKCHLQRTVQVEFLVGLAFSYVHLASDARTRISVCIKQRMAHAMAGNFSLFACFNHDAARCSKFPRNTSGSPSD